MSTEDQNRAVVTLQKGVDTEEFVNQMLDAGYELHNDKPGSKRNFDFVMTQEQAATLRDDARVIDVRYGSKVDNGIHLIKNAIQETQQYNKDVNAAVGSDHGNWAHASCVTTTDPFTGQSITIPDNFKYSLDGTDVDVVIQDSGIMPDHPEFLASDLTTLRYKTVDWPTISGLSQYTQPAQFHRDVDGHGSHVASTVAGRRLGWAKNANIYSMKILDDPGNTFGASASFEMIRAWHNLKKTNNPEGDTYPVRPTVVNMSWGYFGNYDNIQNGVYRSANWNGTAMQDAYGMVQGQQSEGIYTHPLRVASVDADVQDCLDDGVIMVGAAGNGSHKIDTPTGLDYDNYYTSTVYGSRYYHRGSSPVAQGNVICVGNISYVYVGGAEPLFNSSEKGPRVDVCAPGGNITGAIPNGSTKFNSIATAPHLDNGGYVIGNLNGTSMASPQVAGVLAALLQVRPHYTQEQCLAWLQEVCETGRLHDPTTGTPGTDYINGRALQGAANLFLQTPFVDQNPYTIISSAGGGGGSVDWTTLTETQKIVAGTPSQNAEFGNAVAFNGDGTQLLIGASGDQSSGTNTGKVWSFYLNGNTWTAGSSFTAPNITANDRFGAAIDITGNDTAIIGGWAETVGGVADSGAAHIYERTGNTWSRTTGLTQSDPTFNVQYGASVGISGDYAVVGAPQFDGYKGKVYVWYKSSNTWAVQTTIDGVAANDAFGVKVAIDGDTMAVSAAYANSNVGYINVYTRSGTSWSLQQTINHASIEASTDRQGANSMSLNGDTLIFSSIGYDGNGANSNTGAVIIYTRSGTTWSHQQTIVPSTTTTSSVSLFSGSENTVVIGYFKLNSNTGTAYVYSRSGTTWSLQKTLTGSDAVAGDYFGYKGLAIDPAGQIAVSAGFDDISGQTDAGSLFTYKIS